MATSPTQADALAWVVAKGFPPGPKDRALKIAEEAGEVVGAVIKIAEGRKTLADLAQEAAQLVICTMALAESAGFNLELAVIEEWADIQERTWPTAAPAIHVHIEERTRDDGFGAGLAAGFEEGRRHA